GGKSGWPDSGDRPARRDRVAGAAGPAGAAGGGAARAAGTAGAGRPARCGRAPPGERAVQPGADGGRDRGALRRAARRGRSGVGTGRGGATESRLRSARCEQGATLPPERRNCVSATADVLAFHPLAARLGGLPWTRLLRLGSLAAVGLGLAVGALF